MTNLIITLNNLDKVLESMTESGWGFYFEDRAGVEQWSADDLEVYFDYYNTLTVLVDYKKNQYWVFA